MVQKTKISVALRRFSGGAMAGDAFTSGVCRVGPPTERPLLPWEALELAAFSRQWGVCGSQIRSLSERDGVHTCRLAALSPLRRQV